MVRGRGLQEDERRHGGYLAVDIVDMVDIFRSLSKASAPRTTS